MEIRQEKNDGELILFLKGRLTSTTTPKLEETLKKIEGVTSLVFDLEQLEYLSSSGLRVLLAYQKVMNRQGTMVVRHVGSAIMEIINITGFHDILTIEQ